MRGAKFEMKIPSTLGLYEFMELDSSGYGFIDDDLEEGDKGGIIIGGYSDEYLTELLEKEEENKDGTNG